MASHQEFDGRGPSTRMRARSRLLALTAALTTSMALIPPAATVPAAATAGQPAACAAPDARPTVWILDVRTSVPSRATAGGCTVNDLIDDERTWPTKGAFMRHLAVVTTKLGQQRLLSGAEKGLITSAAAGSDVGRSAGYEAIFDGSAESLRDWSQAPGGSFTLQPDGSIRSIGGLGMLWYTPREFGDFSLRLRFRDARTGAGASNSGVFVRFPDIRTPFGQRPPGSCGTFGAARTEPAWVAIFCGQEIQIYDGDTGDPQKTGSIYNFQPNDLTRARPAPKGSWNEYEIRVTGQHYTVIRNGEVINEFDNTPGKQAARAGDPPTDLRQFAGGFVGLQNHGGGDLVDFREVRVRELG